MECANQGLCDYKTGMCQCFEGYEGVACRRSACPNSCSNAGVCRTVSQIGSSLTSYTQAVFAANSDVSTEEPTAVSVVSGALNYKFWDKDMSQACVCDPGHAGADCSERLCAMGDDPLTLGQHAETQFVDVSASSEFTGTIKFAYTDVFGATWTTAAVTTKHYSSDHVSATKSALADDAAAAFAALPGNVLEGTTVSVGYCEIAGPGYHKSSVASCASTLAAALTNSGVGVYATGSTPTAPSSGYYRVDGLGPVYDATDGSMVAGYSCGGAAATDDVQLNILTTPYCIRYEVHFGGRSGDVASLAVDTSNVLTKTGVTVVEGGHSTDVTSGVTTIASLSSLVGGVAPNNVFSVGDLVHVDIDGTSYGFGTATAVSATGITLSTPDAPDLATSTTGVVKLQETGVHSTTRSTNNVATTITDTLSLGNMIIDSPKVASCTGAGTTACDGYAIMCIHAAITAEGPGATDVASGGNIATSSGTSTLTCAATTSVNGDGTTATTMTSVLGYGDQVKVFCTGVSLGTYTIASATDDTVVFAEAVPDCNTNYYDDASHSTKAARNAHVYLQRTNWVVKTDIDLLTMELNFASKTVAIGAVSCDVSSILADSDSATKGSRFVCSNTEAATAVISASTAISVSGKGTTEASSCSDRGICNTESGLCECFVGYSGVACSSQNALAA